MKQIHFEETDSTSTRAKAFVSQGDIFENTVISADRQTAARGSRGRSWDSGSSNVAASYVLARLDASVQNHMYLYVIALATREVIARHVPEQTVELKWPNDIVIDGRKISGTLHEIERQGSEIYWVAGIGINVSSSPELDDSKAFPAGHLASFNDFDDCSVSQLIEELGNEIEQRLIYLRNQTFRDIKEQYLRHAYRLNKAVDISVTKDKSIVKRGVFLDLADDGCLMLGEGDQVHYFSTADIFPSTK